jgi:hypothetical protein
LFALAWAEGRIYIYSVTIPSGLTWLTMRGNYIETIPETPFR